MKLLKAYLKERRTALLAFLLFCTVFFVTFFLYEVPLGAVTYPALLCAAVGTLLAAADFTRVRKKHRKLSEIQTLSAAMISSLPEAESVADEDYQAIVRALQKEITERETHAAARYRDTVEYYTVWAHQIKTPIAAMRLTLQNEDTALSRKLSAELFRIEQYVEMVLAFLRLDSDSSDYVFREYELDGIVRQAVAKFASEFIDRKIRLVYSPLAGSVITDEKWLSFVVEQVLSNALKYTREGGSVTIFLREKKTLCIADTGIGIAPEDLPRIFEKGYTGYNGRLNRSASGIGLYLCKRICQNLGVEIGAVSEPDLGTTVSLDFEQYELKAE